jgi:bacterioferritin-associated ferredoxin
MYVCLCKGLTDSDIRDAVASGTTSFKELRLSTGVSSGCGTCAGMAKTVFENAKEASSKLDSSLFYQVA